MKFIHYHFDILFSGLLFLVVATLAYACYTPLTEEQQTSQDEYYDNGCYSKKSGSSPRCWNAADWKAYCENTNVCKEK